MGNAIVCGSKGTGLLRTARVLLPDGEIVMVDLPLEAADLMMDHLNHMVVHCSNPEPGPMGVRPTMRALQAHEKLHPGQSYVVHPIPAQSTKSKFRPQPLLMRPRNISKTVSLDDADATREQTDPRKKSAKRSSMQRFQNRVADSASGRESTGNLADTPELNSQASQGLSDDAVAARERQQDQHEEEDEDGDIVLNLNMYMGWRPALESIPESPMGYNPAMDNMQTMPVLCV